MELYKEILSRYLIDKMEISFPELAVRPEELIEMECYQALQKIKAVIEDDSLEDDACFMKIEEIICVLEGIGSDGGSRHDFDKKNRTVEEVYLLPDQMRNKKTRPFGRVQLLYPR